MSHPLVTWPPLFSLPSLLTAQILLKHNVSNCFSLTSTGLHNLPVTYRISRNP